MEQTKVKIFKDSVHGYIYVPEPYVRNLIDNVYFQRLRNIDQTDIRIVYPSAKHDRFSHSLGVFYLGQKAMEALRKDKFFCGNSEGDYKFEEDYRRDEVLFLTACLLHDIGHTPFSHSLEEQILQNSLVSVDLSNNKKKIEDCLVDLINETEAAFCKSEKIRQNRISKISAAPHEMLGSYLIFDKFKSGIRKLEKEYDVYLDEESLQDDIGFIVRMIMGIKYEGSSRKRQVRNCFIELLNGNNFDVDKLDYIVRDTHMSGINNVSVDVERLLGALCIVTKTRYLNKTLSKSNIKENFTITKLVNNGQEPFEMDGSFKGIIRIHRGTKLTIGQGSRIERLCGTEQDQAFISYLTNDQAEFSPATKLMQDNEWVTAGKKQGRDVKLLSGALNGSPFRVYIEDGELYEEMGIKAEEDLEIHFIGPCKLEIKGKFSSIGSLQFFELNTVNGKISEMEALGDLFKNAITFKKEPSEEGFLTYSIGFKKQAVNIIANVLEARNYLYLWVCAHHKVVYYANFLIPVIVKEISRHCGANKNEFPSWELCYDNLKDLDDFYIWTAIRYINSRSDKFDFSESYKKLVDQLFSRVYSKSLYKSLVEFELFFDSFNAAQRVQALRKLQDNTDTSKPSLSDDNTLVAGYLKTDTIAEINHTVMQVTGDEDIILKEVLYVVIEFKQKQLDTNGVYLDMGGDKIFPTSQIRLLSSDKIEMQKVKDQYFYLYYDGDGIKTREDVEAIKEAVKKYLEPQTNALTDTQGV